MTQKKVGIFILEWNGPEAHLVAAAADEYVEF
jgi:hypothetical protein